jgi:hypothetical protein
VGDKVLVTYQGQNIAVVTVESKWVRMRDLKGLQGMTSRILQVSA